MPTRDVQCAHCGTAFAAQSSRASYCSSSCRGKAKRQRERSPEPQPPAAAGPGATPAAGGLVSTVAAELTKASVLDTIPGRAALALAYRIESPMETGSAAASMTKELSRLVEEAKALTPKQQDGIDELDDTVSTKLRLVR